MTMHESSADIASIRTRSCESLIVWKENMSEKRDENESVYESA